MLEPYVLGPVVAASRAFERLPPLPSPERPPRSVCIAHYSGLGDALLTCAMARELKRACPGVRITFIGSRIGAAGLQMCGVYDRTVGFPLPMSRYRPAHVRQFRRALHEERPDVALLATAPGACGTALMMHRGLPVVAWDRHTWLRHPFWFRRMAAVVPKKFEEQHEVHCLLDLLRPLGIDPRPSRPSLAAPDDARERARNLLRQHGIAAGEFIYVLMDGSRYPQKDWSEERLGEVARMLHARHGLRAVFEGTRNGLAKYEALRLMPEIGVSLHGMLDIPSLAAVLEMARMAIGIDSGPMHVAQAVGTPTLVLFGGTSEAQWGPLPRVAADGDRPLPFRTVRAPGTTWVPWGPKELVRRARATMQELQVEHVVEAADQLLRETSTR